MLDLVIAPDPIYKTICTPVAAVNDAVRTTLAAMMETMRAYHAMGMGAPMVGLTQLLVVVVMEDAQGVLQSYQMVNPVITKRSTETSTMEESSITFLGISAPVTRAAAITVEYLDEHGAAQIVHASGLLATCFQHEIDYLDGKNFLDYQPPVKRDMLRRRMEKHKRIGLIPHIHGPNCHH